LRQNGAAILAPTRTHNRCAVVSSGGAMLGSGCGAQIDSDYDAVFRTNCPVLNGYEQDVGTRTDIMVVNGLISRIMANGSHTVVPGDGETGQPRPLWHDGTVAIMWKFADFNFTNDTLNRMRADYNASYVAVRDNDPVNRLFTDSESSVRSSKGIVTILDAMRLCDQVDLFGFADPGGSTARYHFWNASVSTGEHAAEQREIFEDQGSGEVGVDVEHRFIRRLSSEPVPVCRPNASTNDSTG